MKKNTTMPFGFASHNARMSTLVANAWIAHLRFHASTRDQSGCFEMVSVTQAEHAVSRKIAYEVSSSIHHTLGKILSFSDIYKKHEGLGRPSADFIMADDQTVFLHGLLLLGLDTDIAPKFAIQLHKCPPQTISPMELLLGLNLNAYNRIYDYAKNKCYGNTLSADEQELILDFAHNQIKNIGKYLKNTSDSLKVDVKIIESISKEYKLDLGYQVSVLDKVA